MNFGNYEYEFQKPDCFIITCSSVPRKNPVDKKKLPILIDKVLILSDSSVKSVHALGLPLWLSGQNLPARAGDPGSIPGSGRSSGEGNGYPLQYSCLKNSMDRGAWHTETVHGVAKSWTQLSD